MYRFVLRFLPLVSILICSLSAQPRLIKGPIEDARRVRLAGHLHPMANAENDLGPLDPSTVLSTVTLVLQQTPNSRPT